MSNHRLRLDPWAASSLLQKSVRRGETDLAKHAAHALYRFRGQAIFRRLSMIAVEDIGIGDVALLQDVTRISTDKALRSVLGSDLDLIDQLCGRMAEAVKDRSADYLWSLTQLESAVEERTQLQRLPVAELISIALNADVSLVRRAVAALVACTFPSKDEPVLRVDRVKQLLEAFPIKSPQLHDAVARLAKIRAHPFCLMLPLIWSRWSQEGAELKIAADDLPAAEFVNDIPLYVFDFHTAAGKHAIARFAHENDSLRPLLAKWVPRDRWAESTQIGAFYVDAAPVARRLQWFEGSRLSHTGFVADMNLAGCPSEGATSILECMRAKLPDLNAARRRALGQSRQK
jgi:hypothetical protein